MSTAPEEAKYVLGDSAPEKVRYVRHHDLAHGHHSSCLIVRSTGALSD